MSKRAYELFKKMWLLKFRKYYRSPYSNKKKIKQSVYDNLKLTDQQKQNFWDLVVCENIVTGD